MRRFVLFAIALVACSAVAGPPSSPPFPLACDSGPGFPPPCKDIDGDGLCDAWEIAQRLPTGEPLPGADPLKPDIYVQYSYMGWAKVGYEISASGNLIAVPLPACTTDAECTRNNVCHEGRCSHHHKPDAAAIQAVVDSFAARGVILHIDPHPLEIPHALVTTFSRPDDGSGGAAEACAGANVQAGIIDNAISVSFHDIKERYFDPKRSLAYHYAVFAHFNTCITASGAVGNCNSCPVDRATPSGSPLPGLNGTAELPGNDVIVSMGSFFEPGGAPLTTFNVGGIFMHELGHNLGLAHAGDIPVAPGASESNMPNYLSVMNRRYMTSGIMVAAEAGSAVPAICNADTACTFPEKCSAAGGRPGVCKRLDYSAVALNTLDEGNLDESAGVSLLSSGSRDIIRFTTPNSFSALAPSAGPVDWNGNGIIDAPAVMVDLDGDGLTTTVQKGFADWDHGSCQSDSDCPINGLRTVMNAYVPTHASCVQNRCRAMIYAFQCTPWGSRD